MNGKNQKGHLSRRTVLKFDAGVVSTGAITAGLGSKLVFPDQAVAKDESSNFKAATFYPLSLGGENASSEQPLNLLQLNSIYA